MPDPRKRLRVLVVAPFPLRLDGRHGGSRAVAELVARLATRHTLALLVTRAEDEPRVDDRLRHACDLVEEVEIPIRGRSIASRLRNRIRVRRALLRGVPTWAAVRDAPGLRERLERLAREWRPDVVQLEYRITGRFLPLQGCFARCVIVEHDADGPAGAGSRLHGRLERRAWHALGRSAFSAADSVVVFTEHDRLAVSALSGSTPIARIPLGYRLPDPPANSTGAHPPGILFVASYIHPPNTDAAVWLARDIYPLVRGRVPAASLQLVGSHPSATVRALEGPGVAVHADVPDVWPYLDAAAVVAAPIRLGGGMRVKVLEALAAGKAMVATPLALEGLELTNGEQVLVAETASTFAACLVELLTDVERRRSLAEAARRWAEKNLDVEAQARAFEGLYATVLGSTAAARASGVGGT